MSALQLPLADLLPITKIPVFPVNPVPQSANAGSRNPVDDDNLASSMQSECDDGKNSSEGHQAQSSNCGKPLFCIPAFGPPNLILGSYLAKKFVVFVHRSILKDFKQRNATLRCVG